MECRDAQFYLRLRRQAADELEADATAALDAHLTLCPGCAADARIASVFDRAVAGAMRAVTVPVGLREQLITRAAAAQGAALRLKLYRAAAACSAAVVLLCIGIGVFSSTRPKVDTQEMVNAADEQENNPGEATRRWLSAQGLPPLPQTLDFDDKLCVSRGFMDHQGVHVPALVYISPGAQPGDPAATLTIYIFRGDGRFDLKGLQDAQASRASARVMTRPDPFRGSSYVYVFVYTTQDLHPFLRTRNGGIGI
jgi:hypothetical protein